MSITTTTQTVLVDAVTSITVTDVQQDTDSGLFIREVRVFGTPLVAGGAAPQVFVLRLGAVQRSSVAIATPESNF